MEAGRIAAGEWIAIDWGSSNRRAWLMADDGRILDSFADALGVLTIPDGGYAAAMADLRARWGDRPALAAGMVGSTRGWMEAPYVMAPATLGDLARAIRTVPGAQVAIVPGVCTEDDVMRGEEVQILGAVAEELVPGDALLCQPGTHNKWAWVADGGLLRFRTTLAGELFALLRAGSILSDLLSGPVADGPAFRAGVSAAAQTADLLAQLFGVRARVLLGRLPAANAAAYASGLVIGADIAPRIGKDAVHVLADRPLGDLYAAAIVTLGGTAHRVDSARAFLAGMCRIRELAA